MVNCPPKDWTNSTTSGDYDCPWPCTSQLCNETIAERFGTQFEIMLIVWIVMTVLSTLFCSIHMMFKLSHRGCLSRANTIQKQVYITSLICSIILLVLSFDPFGWTGDYPQYVFRVCSDVLLASVISLGILVIDSWLEVAKVVAALKDGRTFTGKDAAPVDYHVLPGEEHIDDEEDVDDPTKGNILPDAQVAKNPFMDFLRSNPPQDVIRDSPQSVMDKISLYFVRGCLIGVWTWTLAVAAYEVVNIRQIEWVPVVIKGVVYQLFISIVLCFGWYHALRIYRFVEEVHRFQFDTTQSTKQSK